MTDSWSKKQEQEEIAWRSFLQRFILAVLWIILLTLTMVGVVTATLTLGIV